MNKNEKNVEETIHQIIRDIVDNDAIIELNTTIFDDLGADIQQIVDIELAIADKYDIIVGAHMLVRNTIYAMVKYVYTLNERNK